jgi:hypothetical protein
MPSDASMYPGFENPGTIATEIEETGGETEVFSAPGIIPVLFPLEQYTLGTWANAKTNHTTYVQQLGNDLMKSANESTTDPFILPGVWNPNYHPNYGIQG